MVECQLPKLKVASSSLVARSKNSDEAIDRRTVKEANTCPKALRRFWGRTSDVRTYYERL